MRGYVFFQPSEFCLFERFFTLRGCPGLYRQDLWHDLATPFLHWCSVGKFISRHQGSRGCICFQGARAVVGWVYYAVHALSHLIDLLLGGRTLRTQLLGSMHVSPNIILFIRDMIWQKSSLSLGRKLFESIHQRPFNPVILFPSGLGYDHTYPLHLSCRKMCLLIVLLHLFQCHSFLVGCSRRIRSWIKDCKRVRKSATKRELPFLHQTVSHTSFLRTGIPLCNPLYYIYSLGYIIESLVEDNRKQTSVDELLRTIQCFGVVYRKAWQTATRGQLIHTRFAVWDLRLDVYVSGLMIWVHNDIIGAFNFVPFKRGWTLRNRVSAPLQLNFTVSPMKETDILLATAIKRL